MIHHFDHRFGTYAGQTEEQANQGKLPEFRDADHADPSLQALPRYWVAEAEVDGRIAQRWEFGWLLGWRDITGTEKTRTVIATIIPRVGVGNTVPLFLSLQPPPAVAGLLAVLSSFALDYLARQKVGGTHLTYGFLKQFPIPSPGVFFHLCPWGSAGDLASWLGPRILELTFTAHDLAPFARDCGWSGPPFRWDPARRFEIRCELDAASFHLYGIDRDDVDYILDTFPIVRRNDEKRFGEYRTKRRILELYDRMQRAMETGEAFVSELDPPPGDARAAHSEAKPNGRGGGVDA